MTDRGPDPAGQDHPAGRADAAGGDRVTSAPAPDPAAAPASSAGSAERRLVSGPIASVAIASDPLMTSEREQWANLRWMKDLFSRPIAQATGLPVRALISGEGETAAFSRARAFELSDIPLDGDATQFWFDESRISDATLAYLARCGLDASTLVVGYEMSAQTRAALDRIGAPWVDVWLHPIRFYDDVLFGFRASHPEVHAAFAAFHVPEDQFHLYADRIRIQTYKGWKKAEARIEPGAAVFVGQRMEDKSVCRDGRMLNLLDFREEFSALARRTPQLLYQRHPFERTGDEAVLDFVASHPKAELSRHPVYHLLSSPDLAEVMTISSSVAQEAVYFDKPVTLLHRPVVAFSDPMAPGQFHSICQDFVSPHFWAAALAPLTATRADAPKVGFLDPKDKIRDMLGFYWSYRHIDKVEADRFTLANSRLAAPRPGAPAPDAAPDEAPETTPPPPEPDFTGFANTLRSRDAMFAAIDDADMISLDVFETLIERLVERPGQLFLFLADPAREQLGGQVANFARARLTAAEEAIAAGDMVGEEVTLRARYEAIGRAHGLTRDQVETLLARELDWERRLVRARPIGRAAFDRARAQGKRVVLVSDTYFEPDFVAELLRGCGYDGWDALYCSSEHGVTKKSGKLFQHLLKTEGRRPTEILHMGDNPRTDLRPGRDAGLGVFHMRSTADIARRVSPLPAIWDRIADPKTAAAVKGLTARRVAGSFRRGAPGFSQGSAETLGYAVLGPMFFGLANWLRRRARADEVPDLLFLSRDGDIIKRCYDVIATLDPGAPASRYMLASRRALGVATLRRPEDLSPRLEANFAPMTLAALLRNRFGVAPETMPGHALAAHGLELGDMVAWKEDRGRLAAFLAEPAVAAAILDHAADEREDLLAYYAECGIGAAQAARGAVVDIGHRGTLQKGLRDLLGAPGLRGYYFATFEGIRANIPDAEAGAAAGYLLDRQDPKSNRDHGYFGHSILYEVAFLNDAGSFVRARRGPDGRLEALLTDAGAERGRAAFARACHAGAVAFCEDMAEGFGEAALGFRLTGAEAASGFRAMLEHPFPADARLFRGMGFENSYNGVDFGEVVAEDPLAENAVSLWPQGAAVLAGIARARAEAAPAPRPGRRERVLRGIAAMLGRRR